MRAGQLDREITIQEYSEGTPDEYGNSVPGYVDVATVRAQLIQSTIEEYQRAYGEGANTAVIFRIRWTDQIETSSQITYGGKTFNIREIKEIGRRNGLELRCEEVRT